MNTPQRCLLHRQNIYTKQEYHLESDCCQCLHFYLVAEHEQNTAELIDPYTLPNRRAWSHELSILFIEKTPPFKPFFEFWRGGLFISTTSLDPKFRFSHFEGGVFSRGVFPANSTDFQLFQSWKQISYDPKKNKFLNAWLKIFCKRFQISSQKQTNNKNHSVYERIHQVKNYHYYVVYKLRKESHKARMDFHTTFWEVFLLSTGVCQHHRFFYILSRFQNPDPPFSLEPCQKFARLTCMIFGIGRRPAADAKLKHVAGHKFQNLSPEKMFCNSLWRIRENYRKSVL